MVVCTSRMEERIYLVLSKPISIPTSSGRSFLMNSSRSFTSSTISIWFAPGCGIITVATMGTPSIFMIPRKSSGLNSARPMSRTRMSWSPDCFRMRLLNSSGVVISPRVRMVSSVVFPSMLPAGSSTFSRIMAFRTSSGVIW